MREQRIAVIGAGPCGLAVCKTLDEFGIDYECLEAGQDVGGIWNVERGRGGGYRSLQTNTPASAMDYTDFPFPADAPPYPTAAEMLDYFRSYAERFGLTKQIRFGTRVQHARPLDGGGWQLELSSGETREYSSLVVATGQYNHPRRPHDQTPGHFSGEVLHVFDYLDAATPIDCRDRRVVVVGLGSSAAELAAELSDPEAPAGRARQVLLSARSGRWVLPKTFDGQAPDGKAIHPATPLPAAARLLPLSVGTWLMRRVVGKVLRAQTKRFGGAAALGLPEPGIEPWADRPSLSDGLIAALQAERIDVRPGIASFDGPVVHFTDGTQAEADVVLYATGYQLGFPFLDTDTLGCEAPDLALYQRIVHPRHADLFFVGCCRVMCSMWPLAEQQSRWIARLLTGAFSLPGRAGRTRKAVPLASSLPVMCGFYVEALRRQAGGL